jgi:hypothetical protein
MIIPPQEGFVRAEGRGVRPHFAYVVPKAKHHLPGYPLREIAGAELLP